jgi:hypothetical protein
MTHPDATGKDVANTDFDYAGLDAEVAAEARAAADRIRALGRRLDEAIGAIGEELIDIKEKLGHGQFGRWLKAEFGMSPDTAERYMRVMRVFGDKIRTVRFLKPTTLYTLSAKVVPETVRNKIVERIEGGEQVSDSEVRAVIDRAKTLRKEPTPRGRKLSPASPPKPVEPLSQTRAKAIVAFSTLLHQRLADTLDDLTRMLGDEQRRIRDIPLPKRVVLARGYLNALGVTLADLQPIEDAS